ncbi:chromate transporter [Anaerococcus tetradius]|uniref:chromate transporter n=1 Tax=Anaerococcus tetradius TaxID=33036 RepID=UPI0023F224FF|nr:chromate transporter [Anaerococcus tetradius]
MLINLYITFFKIGLFSFGGGYASLPLIQQEVVASNNWLSTNEFNDLITISQMTPGPIAINSATFVGTRLYGVVGGLVATLGCVTPSLIIVGMLAYFYKKYKNLTTISNILYLLRPAIISMILIAGVEILRTAIFTDGRMSFSNLDYYMLVLFILSFLVMVKRKTDPIKLMLGSGLIYLLVNILFG